MEFSGCFKGAHFYRNVLQLTIRKEVYNLFSELEYLRRSNSWLSTVEYALMAGASYITTRDRINRFPVPQGWIELQVPSND